MRWIDRGPEPDGIQEYARHFTQAWVDYFARRVEERPESHWLAFRGFLAARSANVCWYCERLCSSDADAGGKAPTVDHFRPLSRYLALAYQWTNWIFSCHRCNADNKRDSWPNVGYVDPGATNEQEKPEHYFDYDAATGHIILKSGLSPEAREKAQRTIDDLGLNKLDVQYYRQDWIRRLIADWEMLPAGDRLAFTQYWTQLGFEFAGATRMALQALGSSEGT